jgi:hypothetical protein
MNSNMMNTSFTWRKDGNALLLLETGQSWNISHWTDQDFLDFLEQDDQICNIEMLEEN